MKKILLALSLSTLLLSGCGAKDSDNSLPVETNQLSEKNLQRGSHFTAVHLMVS